MLLNGADVVVVEILLQRLFFTRQIVRDSVRVEGTKRGPSVVRLEFYSTALVTEVIFSCVNPSSSVDGFDQKNVGDEDESDDLDPGYDDDNDEDGDGDGDGDDRARRRPPPPPPHRAFALDPDYGDYDDDDDDDDDESRASPPPAPHPSMP
jgi:hypothetical protein